MLDTCSPASNLRRALRSLGTTLADRGLRYHVAVVGGAALLLRDDHDRPTGDVDVAAVAEDLDEPLPRLELPSSYAAPLPTSPAHSASTTTG